MFLSSFLISKGRSKLASLASIRRVHLEVGLIDQEQSSHQTSARFLVGIRWEIHLKCVGVEEGIRPTGPHFGEMANLVLRIMGGCIGREDVEWHSAAALGAAVRAASAANRVRDEVFRGAIRAKGGELGDETPTHILLSLAKRISSLAIEDVHLLQTATLVAVRMASKRSVETDDRSATLLGAHSDVNVHRAITTTAAPSAKGGVFETIE